MVLVHIAINHEGVIHPVEFETRDGLETLLFLIFSVTNIPPESQVLLGLSSRPVFHDSDASLLRFEDGLQLVVQEKKKSEIAEFEEKTVVPKESDEMIARRLQEEEDAKTAANLQADLPRLRGSQYLPFQGRLESLSSHVFNYEDPRKKAKARSLVPLAELEEKAAISLYKKGESIDDEPALKEALLRELLYWFKSWFSWVDAPTCTNCGAATKMTGMGQPTLEELQFEGNRVEQFNCTLCWAPTRFVRYNDPEKLLETRKGRCGEWANCFTLFCRALGYDSRHVVDWTDHVWTECYSEKQHRWIHLDPCEAAFDTPLLYESGWGKKLTYVIAFSVSGVRDVTKRYTRNWSEILVRRTEISEEVLDSVSQRITARFRARFSQGEKLKLKERDSEEKEEFDSGIANTSPENDLSGRKTGSVEWRAARGELGSSENRNGGKQSGSPSSSSSVRVKKAVKPSIPPKSLTAKKAMDSHVSDIFSAVGDMCQFLTARDNAVQDVQVTQMVLKTMGKCLKIVQTLKEQPFKSRKLTLEPIEYRQLEASHGLNLIKAIGMAFAHTGQHSQQFTKSRPLDQDLASGAVVLVVGTTPVQVAVCLSVAEDLLLEFMPRVRAGEISRPGALRLVVEGERAGHGFVDCDDENKPNELAANLLDGLKATKWLHTNGLKGGAWVTYQLPRGESGRVLGYSLTSADDCPERDPQFWVFEGSPDHGRSWLPLDAPNSQQFESRHCRKAFFINPKYRGAECSVFRLRFPSNPESPHSLLQLSCFDIFLVADKSAKAKRLQVVPDIKPETEVDATVAALLKPLTVTENLSESHLEFKSRVESIASYIFDFEEPRKKTRAKALIPIDELEQKAAMKLQSRGESVSSEPALKEELLRELIVWFKSWFTWVDAPPCSSCGAATRMTGMGQPTLEELQFEGNRVEQFNCTVCRAPTRFVRYNDPEKLLETRMGRNGEWVCCFMLLCRALGYEARHVVDWTDHVWTEVYSEQQGRWIHIDPCEAAFDTPLLYENGWGKKLSYVIAFSNDGVCDVTRRYTREWTEVQTRRTEVPEDALTTILSKITTRLRARFPEAERARLKARDEAEVKSLATPPASPPTVTWGETGDSSVGVGDWARDEMAGHLSAILGDICLPVIGREDEVAVELVQKSLEKLLDCFGKLNSHSKTYLMSNSEFNTLDSENVLRFFEVAVNGAKNGVAKAVAIAEHMVREALVEMRDEATGGALLLAVEGNRVVGGFISSNCRSVENRAVNLFDGLPDTKWAYSGFSPARGGAWVAYHLPRGTMRRAIGYTMTSAEDCPEFDPSDWVLEGTSDRGSTWVTLDQRSGQKFSLRSQKKAYFIPSDNHIKSNAFRLKVSSVAALGRTLQLSTLDIFVDREFSPGSEAEPAPLQLPPATAVGLRSSENRQQTEFRALVKLEYEKLLDEGKLSANKAAAEALRRAKAKMGSSI